MTERRRTAFCLTLLFAGCVCAPVAAASPDLTPIRAPVRGFDFGPADSPAWPGFQKVTPQSRYSPETGFGWEQPSTQFLARDYGHHDPLTRDFCRPQRGDALFHVKQSEGRHLVTVIFGDRHQYPALYPYQMKLEGRPVIDWQPDHREFFKHAALGWWPGESIWKYMADRYRIETFEVDVADGRLDVWLKQYFFLTAMLVCPADHRKDLETALKAIDRDRKRLFEAAWPETPPLALVADKISPKSFEPSALDRARGYTVFARLYQRPMYPSSLPAPHELKFPVRAEAARGETEPVTIGFLPWRNFDRLRVRITDMAGPDGARIRARSVTLYRTRFKEIVFGSRLKSYFVWPRMLDEVSLAPVQGGVTGVLEGSLRPYPANAATQLWLTLHTPEDARPGDYDGRLVLQPDGAPKAEIGLRWRVHPFELRAPDRITYSMVHSPAYGLPHRVLYRTDEERKLPWRYLERDCRFLHGLRVRSLFTSFLPEVTWHGDVPELDFRNYTRTLDILKRCGLAEPLLNFGTSGAVYAAYRPGKRSLFDYMDKNLKLDPRFLKRITAYCRELKRESQRSNWPTIYFATLDEASNRRERGWAAARQIAEAMKAGGVMTFETANGRGQLNYLHAVNLPVMNFAAVLKAETFEKIRTAGRRFGLYNIGTIGDRFTWGLYPWRVGAVYRTQWHYRATSADPYNDFDGRKTDAATIAYPTLGGLIPTPFSEGVREGIEDGWYLSMLETETENADEASAAAKKARNLIEKLKRRVPQDFSLYFGRARRYDPNPGPPRAFAITPEEMAGIRQQVAEAIAGLRATHR